MFGLRSLVQILALEGNFTVVATATDGREALRLAAATKPDLVLMDYRMRHLDGIEAARFMKQLANPPKVVIITSDNSPECQTRAKAAGADGFVDQSGELHNQLPRILKDLFGPGPGAYPPEP